MVVIHGELVLIVFVYGKVIGLYNRSKIVLGLIVIVSYVVNRKNVHLFKEVKKIVILGIFVVIHFTYDEDMY